MSASTAKPSTASATTRNKHSKKPAGSGANAGYSDSKSNIDITKEEFSRLKNALDNAEFRKMFLDYVAEIQDPENRKRYEEEIIQLEAERGVDVRFVNPEPGFVIKSSVDGLTKCFVNVAKSAEVAKPSNEVSMNPDTGTRGLNWSIPMAQAGPRDDLDAQGKRCCVYDVIFHPDALYLAERSTAFRKCLVDTALDAVEREYKVQLDRANLKFPKLQFKGVARPTVIRRLAKNASPEANEPHPLESIYPARPTAGDAAPKVLPLKMKTTAQPDFSTPKYSIKHRRDVDLAEYTNELDAKLLMTVPREIVVEIELPLLSSTADCKLDVTARSLYLLSERAGAKYRLRVELPYVVDDKRGRARFDTDTRRLAIVLPVVQECASKQREMHDTLLHLNREDSGVESDIREEVHSSSESPIEELSSDHADGADVGEQEQEQQQEQQHEEDPSPAEGGTDAVAAPTSATFLRKSLSYQFPGKFDCNVLDNVMSLVLHVRNVQPESIALLRHDTHIHLQFTSIGSGYFPTHYAFYLQVPQASDVRIAAADAEAWENNVVLNVHLADSSENLHGYLAGLDASDLREYTVQEKFRVAHNSRQRRKQPSPASLSPSLSPTLEISVERSDCERSVEIEIKPRHEQLSTCAANTTEDDDDEDGQRADHAQLTQPKKKNKQKKKNKKRRSLSESACDDIKAYQQQQQQQHHKMVMNTKKLAAAQAEAEGSADDDDNDENSSPERSASAECAPKPAHVSPTMAVPTNGAPLTAQQRKQRSYSECRDSVIGSSAGSSTLPPSFKGILKHCSRYGPRPSISDSCSSIDDYSSSYSCSMDGGSGVGGGGGASVPNSLRFSKSFSDIPEENVTAGLSESCKKTVRFNEVIRKQVFRLDSSILGQRKKNQKRRERKLRAFQRRVSEGDSADYEDNNGNKPVSSLPPNAQYFKVKNHNNSNGSSDDHNQENHQSTTGRNNTTTTNNNHQSNNLNKSSQHDSGLDLSQLEEAQNEQNKSGKSNKAGRRLRGVADGRPRLESESSSDIDGTKGAMIFEMDM